VKQGCIGVFPNLKIRPASDRRRQALPKDGKSAAPGKSLDRLDKLEGGSSTSSPSKSEIAEERFVAAIRAKIAEGK
jgi:hypothetical protein